MAARIISVADVFVALSEDRPYRKSLPSVVVREIMLNMCKDNKLDKNVLRDLFENFENARYIMDDVKEKYLKNNVDINVYYMNNLFDENLLSSNAK